jgi:hypothetical protein
MEVGQAIEEQLGPQIKACNRLFRKVGSLRKSGVVSRVSVIGSDKLEGVVDGKKETKWRQI